MTSEFRQPLRVGVTGHRKLGDDHKNLRRIAIECERLLEQFSQQAEASNRQIEAYSLLALGADQIFARAALNLGIPLLGVIPFETYASDFRGESLADFERLLSACRRVVRLPINAKSLEAYMAGGRALVDETEILVAVWNGLSSRNLGGTGDVVAYARSLGRPVHVIDATKKDKF